MDRLAASLLAVPPRAWLLVSLVILAPAWIAGSSPVSLAISLGGVLLAAGSLANLVAGIPSLSGALIAWRRVAPVFHADWPISPGSSGRSAPGMQNSVRPAALPVLLARDLTYRYPMRQRPALRDANLEIRRGDRLLIEGPSGGGKSTLVALLAGLRAPENGILRLYGLDRGTLGTETWRRSVALAPQFHENHLFSESLAFNLLMGRGWPPRPADLELALQVCIALGLEDLIARMPAGLFQQVGECGWQLSHGERSRVFLARALLQGAEVIIMDESFGALDPVTMQRSVQATLQWSPALVVVAHP
jgi:ATP-binding cassette subfamily B protein